MLKSLLYSLVETYISYFDIFTLTAGRRDSVRIELNGEDVKKLRIDKIAPDLAKSVPLVATVKTVSKIAMNETYQVPELFIEGFGPLSYTEKLISLYLRGEIDGISEALIHLVNRMVDEALKENDWRYTYLDKTK